MSDHHHIKFCERCGAELLPADPAPLCTSCFVSDSSVYAPSLLLVTDASWSGSTPSRPAAPISLDRTFKAWQPEDTKAAAKKRMVSRRVSLAIAAALTVGMLFAIVPAALSGTEPGPVRLGVQQTDKGTDACVANLYILLADKRAGRPSPANIVCPVTGEPYVYTQYLGVTTIACPNPGEHQATRVYVRTDVGTPAVN
jgi:hypothetical protein